MRCSLFSIKVAVGVITAGMPRIGAVPVRMAIAACSIPLILRFATFALTARQKFGGCVPGALPQALYFCAFSACCPHGPAHGHCGHVPCNPIVTHSSLGAALVALLPFYSFTSHNGDWPFRLPRWPLAYRTSSPGHREPCLLF